MCTRRWGSVYALLVLIMVGGMAVDAEAQDTSRMMSATLLRRLGEAVDGYRTGNPVFVVAQFEFPHEVLGVFTRAQAMQVAHGAGAGYMVFGPYVAPEDNGEEPYVLVRRHSSDSIVNPNAVVPPTCPKGGIHRPDSYCPPRDSIRSFVALPVSEIRDIAITVHMNNGQEVVSAWRPNEIDAVFLTLSAFDKFAIPYYTSVFGAEYAAQIRRDYVELLQAADK